MNEKNIKEKGGQFDFFLPSLDALYFFLLPNCFGQDFPYCVEQEQGKQASLSCFRSQRKSFQLFYIQNDVDLIGVEVESTVMITRDWEGSDRGEGEGEYRNKTKNFVTKIYFLIGYNISQTGGVSSSFYSMEG